MATIAITISNSISVKFLFMDQNSFGFRVVSLHSIWRNNCFQAGGGAAFQRRRGPSVLTTNSRAGTTIER